MMFLTTRTETEALLLEQNLIKQLKPRYNVLLRDDKSFPNILSPPTTPFRRSASTAAAKRQGQLFRPLRQRRRGQPHAQPAAEGVPAAQLLGFVFESRTRPCLLYQIKRCAPLRRLRLRSRTTPRW
jgi:excinuclease ABC subunit C